MPISFTALSISDKLMKSTGYMVIKYAFLVAGRKVALLYSHKDSELGPIVQITGQRV